MAQAVSILPRPRAGFRVPTVLREVGRAVVAGLDGLLAGLTVGYIALTALGAPANALGLPDPIAIGLVGVLVSLVALAGALAGIAISRGVAWFGERLSGAIRARGHARVAGAIASALRLVTGLPAGWLGGFAVLLWIALVGRTVGPLGLLTPPGVLSTFVYAIGLGVALAAMARAVQRPRGGVLRRAAGAGLAIGAGVVVVAATSYAAWPGTSAGLVPYDPAFDGDEAIATAVTPHDLEDPGAPGPFDVEHLSYGSGTDARRPAFGDEATLRTPTVDASAVLPALDGGADAVRRAWWGFGTDALPLAGLVWAPRGEGPFPLVLIVHGNHAMGDFSEGGYAYLAEHLASRGFIAASVDEDFLNGSWAGEWSGAEQVVRAWLLLLHVDQWRTWGADPASPFFGRVDLDRVALVGHSRGGEAASVAAMLADGSIAPRAAMAPWPTGLGIRAVVSIAPSDGQYASGVRLDGVDFLTIQGGHDSDARAWSGIRQYARTVVRDDGFKAALWSYRANHGQFNTVWGPSDHGPLGGAQLNLAPLLRPAEQEDVAKTAIGAFLEASLHGREAYRGLFRRPMVGRAWLPGDIVLVRFAEADAVPLTGASPDRAAGGLAIETDGFDATTAMHVPLRALQPDQAARAVNARWSAAPDGRPATWGVSGIDALVPTPTSTTELRFALADGSAVGGSRTAPLDITIEVVADDGRTVALPLSAFGALPPPLPVQLAKHDLLVATTTIDLRLTSPAERVLQTYAIPLALFEAADPAFRAERLDGIRLRVERSSAGALWIADVALAP